MSSNVVHSIAVVVINMLNGVMIFVASVNPLYVLKSLM
jgi:hypothetical protein